MNYLNLDENLKEIIKYKDRMGLVLWYPSASNISLKLIWDFYSYQLTKIIDPINNKPYNPVIKNYQLLHAKLKQNFSSSNHNRNIKFKDYFQDQIGKIMIELEYGEVKFQPTSVLLQLFNPALIPMVTYQLNNYIKECEKRNIRCGNCKNLINLEDYKLDSHVSPSFHDLLSKTSPNSPLSKSCSSSPSLSYTTVLASNCTPISATSIHSSFADRHSLEVEELWDLNSDED